MFEGSLVESTPILRTHNRWPALFSFAIQAVLVTALILIPLVHPEVIPIAVLPRVSIVAPRLQPKPPAVIPTARMQVANSTASPASLAPQLPTQAFNTDARQVEAPALAVGLNLGESSPSSLSQLTGTSSSGPRISITPAEPSSTKAVGPINISRGVIAGLLIAPITPEYPGIAKATRTEGTVLVQAVISKTGHIESAHVLSGPEMLQAAALTAVRDARYKPFLLNDQPTEVETTISIVFQLHR